MTRYFSPKGFVIVGSWRNTTISHSDVAAKINIQMLSLAKCKEILNPDLNLNDEEIKALRDYLYLIANIIVKHNS